MYLDFYGLSKEAFHITPDPEFLFLSPSHKEALGAMIYGVQQRKGFLAVTGEVGLGKTTVLRSFLEQLDEARVKTVIVFNSNVSYQGLLKIIYRDLGLDAPTDDIFEMVNGLHQVLIEEYHAGRNVVLIIDEAQNMPVETLENLRMLSNLETSKDKLLQILLIGQPELESILDRRELRQLKQRLAVRGKLEPLSFSGSLAYIKYRVEKSGGRVEEIFTRGALLAIIKAAGGIPRKVNIICDNALITGYGYQQKPVTRKIVREVIGDLEGRELQGRFKWAAIIIVLVAALSVLAWAGSSLLGNFLQTARRLPSEGGVSTAPVADTLPLLKPSSDEKEMVRREPAVPAEIPTVGAGGGRIEDSALRPVPDPPKKIALPETSTAQESDVTPAPPAVAVEIPDTADTRAPAVSETSEGGVVSQTAGREVSSPVAMPAALEESRIEAAQPPPKPAVREPAVTTRDPGDAIDLLLRKRSGD